MVCPKCGVKLPDTSRTCVMCGANLMSKNLDKKASQVKKKTKGTHAGTGEEIDRSVNSINYAEYTQKKKPTGKMIMMKIGFILIYLAVITAFCFIAWFMGAAAGVLVYIAWLATWHYTNIEYEYITESGDWDFTKVYGNGRKRVPLLNLKVKDMDIIAPYTSEYEDKYKDAEIVHDFRYDENQTQDIYFATYTDKNGKKNLILFYCTNKAVKIFKSYNKEGTVVTELSR